MMYVMCCDGLELRQVSLWDNKVSLPYLYKHSLGLTLVSMCCKQKHMISALELIRYILSPPTAPTLASTLWRCICCCEDVWAENLLLRRSCSRDKLQRMSTTWEVSLESVFHTSENDSIQTPHSKRALKINLLANHGLSAWASSHRLRSHHRCECELL